MMVGEADPVSRHSVVRALSAFERVFLILIVYYWSLQFLQGDSVEILPREITYYLFVVPAAAWAICGAFYVLMVSRSFAPSALVLCVFLLVLIGVSLGRGDLRTIASTGLLALTIAILLQIRPRVPLNLINLLFVVSILLTTMLFFADYSIYTFVPGIGNHPDLWWRISPMPSVSEGGLFAMVVFVANLAFRRHLYRQPMLWLSAYFLVLAANRTAIFGALLSAAYLLLRQNGFLISRSARATFVLLALAGFMVSVLGSQLLLALPFADSEIMQTLIFREEAIGRFDVGDQVGSAAVRRWIFDQHLAAFRESPFFGIGTFDFRLLNSGYGALDDATTGSEAFVTGLLARIGLLSTLLFAALFVLRQPVSGEAADLSVCARMVLLIGMLTYGSFVNVYDIVFVLLMIAIVGGIQRPSPRLPQDVAAVS